jgi:hypothetical protein
MSHHENLVKESTTNLDSNNGGPHSELASLAAEDPCMFTAMMQASWPPSTAHHTVDIAQDYIDHMSVTIEAAPQTPVNGALTQWEQKSDHAAVKISQEKTK